MMRSAKGVLCRIVVVAAMHGALLYALLQIHPDLKKQIAPLVVSLITPPQPLPQAPPPPPPQPPRKPPPRQTPPPVVQAVTPPSPVTPTPAAISVEPPADPVSAAPGPPAAAVAPAAAAAPPQPPPPVVPARFDAAYLNNPPPVYPAVARRRGEQGSVQLRVYVSAAGVAEKVEVFRSSGSGALDVAAREAVGRWRFVPARQGDQAVGAWVIVPIVFTFEG